MTTNVSRILRVIVISLSALITSFTADDAQAQSALQQDSGFVEDTILTGLPLAAAVAFAPDTRLFLALKNGEVRVAVNGALLPKPFLSIPEIVNRVTDRGLLAIAVDPDFPAKPFVYISFVYDPPELPPDTRDPRAVKVARITADAAQGYNVAVPGSLEIIVGKNSSPENMAPASADPLTSPLVSCMSGFSLNGAPIQDCIGVDGLSHSAGTLIFGPGRTLYASFGDGASYEGPNTTGLRTQNIDTLSGKLIRFNPDTGAGLPDNPFYDAANPTSNRSRVWAYGFRNPFRVTLDPKSGQAYISDVGTSYFEEINVGKGGNFGWPCFEGGLVERAAQEGQGTGSLPQVGYRAAAATKDFCAVQYAAPQELFRPPMYTYRHKYDADKKDLGASITGIAFYAGNAYPEKYRGALFFGDYALRYIRYLTFDLAGRPTANDFALETGSTQGVVQLLAGPDTNIYALYLDVRSRTSQLRRFRYTGNTNTPPVIVAKASPTAGDVPLVVSFSSAGTNDPDGQGLTYTWDFGDGTTSTDPNPTKVYDKVGTYIAKLTARESSASFAKSEQVITIRTGVAPPRVFIDEPREGVTYAIGDTLRFSGRASLANDPTGSTVALSWTVIQRHNDHEHIMDDASGPNGSFLALEHTDDTAYAVCLFATAGEALEDQKCLEITPRRANYTIASDPIGAPITYVDEGKELIAPALITPIVSSIQTFSAPSTYGGRTFIGWSDGILDRERTVTVGTSPRTLTARYVNTSPENTFSASPRTGRPPLVVSFDARESKDPDGDPVTFSWDFGDGTTGQGETIQKRFTRAGVFNVTLTVSDTLGARTLRSVTIAAGKNTSPSLAVRAPGQPRCGTEARPCRGTKQQPPRITVTSGVTINSPDVVSIVLERKVGNRWRRVTAALVLQSTGKGRPAPLPRAATRKAGLYRVFLVTQGDSKGRRPTPRYILVR